MTYQDTSTAGAARDEARQVGATTKEQASAVAGTAVDSGKQVAAEAKQQARQVTDEARGQLRNLVHQSHHELKEHASAQTSRAAANMKTLAQQLTALADGRTDEAGGLADYVGQTGDKIGRYAQRLQDGGLDGVVGDARGFARRRPGLFLLGAVAAGFAAGRLIRGAQAAGEDSDASPSQPVLDAGAARPTELPSAPDVNDPAADAAVGAGYAETSLQEDSDVAWLSGGGAVGEA
jgi:polyhydroxyalkanoate synthesis regulator phasin